MCSNMTMCFEKDAIQRSVRIGIAAKTAAGVSPALSYMNPLCSELPGKRRRKRLSQE